MKPTATWEKAAFATVIGFVVVAGLLAVAYVVAIFVLMNNFGSNK